MLTDFARFYRLQVASWYARTIGEAALLREEADSLAAIWQHRREWAGHWQYLDQTCQRCADDQHYGDNVIDDYRAESDFTATMKARSLEQARQLNDEHRHATSISTAAAGSAVYGMPYEAIYTVRGRGEQSYMPVTSWWKARQWLIEQTCTHPGERVDVDITWQDLRRGGKYTLMSGRNADPGALRDELTRLDTLLGGRRQIDGTVWVDELHYEVLCDDYRDQMLAQHNPWGFRHRFEHQLRADDLRDQILDFAHRAGINHSADHLAVIDAAVTRANLYALEPADRTWLDDIVDHAEYSLRQRKNDGVHVEYPNPNSPVSTIRVGQDNNDTTRPWYAEEHTVVGHDGRSGTRITSLGRYHTCQDLIDSLPRHDTGHRHRSESTAAQPIRARATATLRRFDGDITALQNDLNTCRQLRSCITTRRPFTVTTGSDRAETSTLTADPAVPRNSQPKPHATQLPEAELPRPMAETQHRRPSGRARHRRRL
ncbi:hypothetical protein CRH09_15430 [Nocardia terpenica]|uniref:Uncharacterized protein n=2 Tax=Nocardia terpenica TaxID=455432 RepID=A0A291RIG2_9NOCA|nr:hypothetical protein CRH09_15430 [Nocardia terpenica]